MSKPTRNKSARCKPVYIAIFFIILQLCSFTALHGAEKKAIDKGVKNNVFNIYDSERGRVSEDGIIYNQHGSMLGSVDGDGKIYNVSKINIGKVEKDGSVLNQSDTKLGSVNENGEIFNVGERKTGQVKDIKDIKLIGGAARLIILK